MAYDKTQAVSQASGNDEQRGGRRPYSAPAIVHVEELEVAAAICSTTNYKAVINVAGCTAGVQS